MPAPVLQFKRGALSSLPGLRAGEPAFTTDSFDFYVGLDSSVNNNKFFGSHRYWKKETASTGSGVNLVEASTGSDYITLKSPDSLSGITTYTFPASPTDGYFLKTNSIGILSWEQVVSDFYISADSGTPDVVSTGSTITFTGGSNVNTAVTDNTITINLDNNISINSLTVPTVNVTNVKANDGTSSITITNGTGAVGFANSVTINGDLFVLGTTTEVNTSTLKVEDSLIDLGLINDNGSLIPPSSDLNIDIGILLNWYSGSAKKAAVYWDDSAQRVGIASDVTESTGVLTANSYAAVEIGALWVTDCAGTSQVISCTGSERFLNNITVDAGQF